MFRSFSLQRDFPVRSRFLEIDGEQLHFVDEGEGPVVVMLHGNPTWSFYYRTLISALKGSYRVMAIDYLGCGLSTRPTKRSYRIVDRIAQVEAVLDHLGITRFSLIMHDWGGPIGTGVAVRRSEHIERLIYFNTTLTETESLPGIIKRATLPVLGQWITQGSARFLKLTTSFGVCRKLPAEIKGGYYHPYRTRAERKAIWDFVQDIPFTAEHPTYRSMLETAERIRVLREKPVQILWGLRDPCFHREMLSKVAAHFPDAEVIEFPQASHLVLEDEPERCVAAISRFLATPRQRLMMRTVPSIRASEQGLYGNLREQIAQRQSAPAVITPGTQFEETLLGASDRYQVVTFERLGALVHKYERGLSYLGLRPQERVIMLVPPSEEFLALAFAVMGRGAVPVFIDPGVGRDALVRAMKESDAVAFIGSPKAHALRLVARDIFRTFRFTICAAPFSLGIGYSLGYLKRFSALPLAWVDRAANDAAFVAFTSGGTGQPKGVVYTNQMVAAQLNIFREQFGLTPGSIDLPLLPIFSIFGAALGVTSVYPPMNPAAPLSSNPADIVRCIRDQAVTTSFGSPTLWNRISEYCVRSSTKLESVRKIFIAGTAVSPAVLDRVSSAAPHAVIATPYGATEALPVTLVTDQELRSAEPVQALTGEIGTLVGKPVVGVTVKIVREVDGPMLAEDEFVACRPREIGEIVVRGANVNERYLLRPEANRRLKVSASDGGVWHRMGDVGYVDEAGLLYFCGRQSHVVRTPQRVYYSVPVERVFEKAPEVRRTALISMNGGKEAAVVIEPEPGSMPTTAEERLEFARRVARCAEGVAFCEGISSFFFHPSFPVDARHQAKIFRDKLGIWAAGEEPVVVNTPAATSQELAS